MIRLAELSPRHLRRVLVDALLLRASRASGRADMAIALASRWRDVADEARDEAEHWIALAEAGAQLIAREIGDEQAARAALVIPVETRRAS